MSLLDSISQLRRDFSQASFNEQNADPNPFEQFRIWFEDAIGSKILDPNAFALSTSTIDGKPSSRMLLLKSFDENGFVFFTNYDSRKGQELASNPFASLLFYWDINERQIRIEGKIVKISAEESDAYFQTRPYTSRLGAWASKQSSQLKSRYSLIKDVVKLTAKYTKTVPLPPYWGGYRMIPDRFEFWQGRPSRLHDRILYTKENENWNVIRLYP